MRAEKGGRNHTEILNAWKLKKVGGIEVFCSVRKSGREEFVNVGPRHSFPVMVNGSLVPVTICVRSLPNYGDKRKEGMNEGEIERKRDAKRKFFRSGMREEIKGVAFRDESSLRPRSFSLFSCRREKSRIDRRNFTRRVKTLGL